MATSSWHQGANLVSNKKAKFLTGRPPSPSFIGDEWFWMDVSCIDQRDKEARIAVTQYIPAIYLNAERTLGVRDGSGFRECCLDAMGNISQSEATVFGWQSKLLRHYTFTHSDHDTLDPDRRRRG
jgi:hypothetical protein